MMKLWIFALTGLLVFCSGELHAKTYKIGLIMPLSGKDAGKGIPMKHAVELCLSKYNKDSAARGGPQIELVVKDDFNDPERAKGSVAELLKDESLMAVIGHYHAETALATAKQFADAKIPFISPYGASPDLLKANPWAFTLNVTDFEQGAFMAVYIKEVLKKDHVLVIHNNDAFGQSLKLGFVDKAARIGLHVNKVLAVERKLTDMNWAEKNLPDMQENSEFGVIAGLTRSETAFALLPQLRKRGLMMPVMATSSWTDDRFLEMPVEWTNTISVVSPFLYEVANNKAAEFVTAYKSRYKDELGLNNAMAYDAALLLSKVIEKLDSPTSKIAVSRSAIRESIANLDWEDSIEGVTGLLHFKNKHYDTKNYVGQYLSELQQPSIERKFADKSTKVDAAQKFAHAPDSKAPIANIGHEVPSKEVLDRGMIRDMFVSQIDNGRYRLAPIQLFKPHDEYVLSELSDQVKKGLITVVDGVPYHVVDVVLIGMDVVRINDVNIKDMQWDVDLFIWFKWSSKNLDIAEIEKIIAINAVKEGAVVFNEDLTGVNKFRVYRKHLTLTSPFNLSDFPFDTQTLKLFLAHTNKPSTRVLLSLDSRHMDNGPISDIKPQEWTFLGKNFFSDLYRYESTFGVPNYRPSQNYKSPIYFSTVNLNIQVKRILQPYIYTFFLPLIIILGIILMVLWVPLKHFGPRISAAISGLVGVLVYHMAQKNSFPKVGYTMFADYYFLATYILVVSLMFFIIRLEIMMSLGHEDRAKVFNRRIRLGSLIGACVIYGAMTLWGIFVL